MKLKNLLMLLLCTLAGITLTSCLSNDDDDKNTITPLTPQQKVAQLTDMAGNYTGQVFFANDSTQLIDSINGVNWHVVAGDSTLFIDNIPMKVVGQGLPDTDLKKELIKSERTIPVDGNISLYVNENNSKGYYTFWAIPKGYKTQFQFEFGGKAHDVVLEFAYQMTTSLSSYYSTSTYYATGEYYDSQMVVFCLLRNVKCDGSSYTINRVFVVKGKRN